MPDTRKPTNLRELLEALEEAGDDMHVSAIAIPARRLASYERHGYIGFSGYRQWIHAKEAL
jgi:hypothetical protein